jgi:hypothetical protein
LQEDQAVLGSGEKCPLTMAPKGEKRITVTFDDAVMTLRQWMNADDYW